MGLTHAAIIVIVLVGCLAVTALGASLFKHYNPNPDAEDGRFSAGYEQKLYMAEVRARGFNGLIQACSDPRDLEARYTPAGSGYYRPHTEVKDSSS
ncbi:hypothetical protein N7499_006479 [Penicillium canescens]|uniref:Uncharacterized protein n=1 Tax=Penicillium canescens TaxID=5083 RepID=A0AAD6IDJ1_PENCN|nr:uncharacterized protein N7446_002170 [Penicillium canescens]KAJ5997213.1 hypothetical protein N7522_008873 [Penicillium canescens]KAJ6043973.1 hypothetical protein N7460_005328 [Penicillium canescens]KAJ6055446.1 hypothetical protein N7444_004544 [Penicillium canescens]KAJ6074393.1 hypothetical protein N7446_002170 [Penicillium canescens]KAJ6081605.1 hypothetical protein N7499_006479 [Penicillium canescens]